MVGQQLKSYIESCGLAADDVPKVVASFMALKYGSYAATVLLSIRYHPLRRVFLARKEALGLGHAGLSAQPRRIVESARSKYRDVQASYRDAKGRWHSAGRELLLRQQLLRSQQQQRLGPSGQKIGWYAWSSAKYWQLSDKLEHAASESRVWQALTRNLKLEPKGLALGFAEGTILFKCILPLYMPLTLLLIVQVFKLRHQRLHSVIEVDQFALDKDRSTAENLVDEAVRQASCVIAAARDAEVLAEELRLERGLRKTPLNSEPCS